MCLLTLGNRVEELEIKERQVSILFLLQTFSLGLVTQEFVILGFLSN